MNSLPATPAVWRLPEISQRANFLTVAPVKRGNTFFVID